MNNQAQIDRQKEISETFSSDNLAEINKALQAKREDERSGLITILLDNYQGGVTGQADAVLESKWLDDYMANQC